ncbi:F0F1 ATP synthase subunit gamma [Thiomicrorhabdus sp. zzn3]|uniref:F0F1 ATP synthase subunit gamma n=1 Tax=Thiomicrorhabdus sp. zzn3 TaxID=3039775 RepID=UPI0024369D0F|nr:F0F1 ATP synthase subunit gamma [Thiomicrorhabdus sp. zzn3]MDG6778806.1 F0F1 ATP synthase subunit gamma [Thiomicrorhabdus sp. zzn3]
MARYHELRLYRSKLEDIREIMHSMKTLAQMESHRLTRHIQQQHAIADHIQQVANDFLHFFPASLPSTESLNKTVLLIGSERGFCGDFNGEVLRCYEADFSTEENVQLIAVGHKMTSLVEKQHAVTALQGANVTEEISTLVEEVIHHLATQKEVASLYAVYQSDLTGEPVVETLLPAFTDLETANTTLRHPPDLNLPPQDFLLELTDHALHHALHRLFYSSLMAENQRRIHHLENATQHLDQKTEHLQRRMNVLRQEAIIEEIEVILLNQANLNSPEHPFGETDNGFVNNDANH